MRLTRKKLSGRVIFSVHTTYKGGEVIAERGIAVRDILIVELVYIFRE